MLTSSCMTNLRCKLKVLLIKQVSNYSKNNPRRKLCTLYKDIELQRDLPQNSPRILMLDIYIRYGKYLVYITCIYNMQNVYKSIFYWLILLGKIIKYNCPKYKYNAISILGNIYKTGGKYMYMVCCNHQLL